MISQIFNFQFRIFFAVCSSLGESLSCQRQKLSLDRMFRKFEFYIVLYVIHPYCRGLAAAQQWGKVWPEMKPNILVTSSIFRLGQSVSCIALFIHL